MLKNTYKEKAAETEEIVRGNISIVGSSNSVEARANGCDNATLKCSTENTILSHAVHLGACRHVSSR